MTAREIRVWDPFVRIAHWALVLLFLVAYFFSEEGGWVHVYSGYAILALVAARIAWGFAGPRNARFGQFLRSPAAAVRYLQGLATGRAERYVGHNPAGAWMAVALLVAILATGGSGLVVLGLEGEGPLAGRLGPDSWAVTLAGTLGGGGEGGEAREPGDEHGEEAHEDEEEYEEEEHGEEEAYASGARTAGTAGGAGGEGALEAAEEAWEEWHELLADTVLVLAIVHVLGVLASSLAHRENLVRSMFTGRKRAAGEPAE
jgi:cytochrome b